MTQLSFKSFYSHLVVAKLCCEAPGKMVCDFYPTQLLVWMF